MPKTTNEPDEPLRDLDWLSSYLGVPRKTVYAWRLNRTGPPAYRIGKHLRWSRAEVDAWLAEHQTPTKGES